MVNLTKNSSTNPTAFFSKKGAEGETDPCLVINGDKEFYTWLFDCFRQVVLSELRLKISSLEIQFRLGSDFRSFLEEGSFVVQLPHQHIETILNIIEPLTRNDADIGGHRGERTVHVFLDISTGFEVILRRHLST